MRATNAQPEQHHILDWCVNLVDELQKIAAAAKAPAVPELEGQFGDEPALAVRERRLPLGIFIGFAGERLQIEFISRTEYRTVPASTVRPAAWQARETGKTIPHTGYVLSNGQVIVTRHPKLPLDENGLPDLRILSLPVKGWRSLKKATAAGAFDSHPVKLDAVVRAPNGPANQELQRALIKPECWQTNTEEASKFYPGPGVTFIYQLHDAPPAALFEETVRNEALRAMDARFCQMNGDLVADVCDILLLHWIAAGRPTKAGITLLKMLEYRKRKPERKTMEEHWQALRDARSIRLRGGVLEDIALFEIDTLRPRQPNLFGIDSLPESDRAYYYSPGGVMSLALNGNHAFFAPYARRILELHPYNHNIAKRLARYLRGDWRLNPEKYLGITSPRYRTWREHLDSAGVEISDRFKKQPTALLTALDDQLLELCRVEALGDWVPNLFRKESGGADWETAARLYHPKDRQRLRSLPYHGRLEAFLCLRVHLPPPADVADALREHIPGRVGHRAQQEALAREVVVRKALGAAKGRA